MGACCTKDYMYGREDVICDKDERDSNGGNDGEEVRRGEDGTTVRLRGSSGFTSMFSQRGRKGINQDAMTVWEDFSGEKDLVFCGVFDGHGPSGHKVSNQAREVQPSKLSKAIKTQPSQLENRVSEATVEPDNPLVSRWEAAFVESYKECDQELSLDSSIDCYCSGTTAVTIIKQGEHLVIANVGDSRAVLCTRGEKNQYIPIQLTVDQKPNVPCEAERIKNSQGRITADEEEPDIYRVWVPDADYPGLAMSRSLGDFCVKDYGVISTPQVTTKLQIWDVLTNKQVISIVTSAINRSVAAKLVVKLAVREWKRRFPGAMIDDCTVICLFFKNPPLLIRSMTNVGRRSVRSHPDLAVSRSCRSMGIERKRGGEEESKDDWKKGVQQGLSRANSQTRVPRFARTSSNNHKMAKFYHEVAAR